MNGGSLRKCPQCWMIDNIGPRILTSGSFTGVTMTTPGTMGATGEVSHVSQGTLCVLGLLNYVGGGDTDLFLLHTLCTRHLLKHLENISGGQSIIN